MARKRTIKTKDKYKSKKWYEVIAPSMFEEKVICEIPGVDDESIINNVVKTSLADVTGKFDENGLYTNIWFKVKNVKGNKAFTWIKGYAMIGSYINTIVRRRRTTVDDVIEVKTKDNISLRIKPIIITANKVSKSAQTSIRLAIRETAKKIVGEKDFDDVMKTLMFGQFANELKNVAKKIVPIDKAVVRRVDVISIK